MADKELQEVDEVRNWLQECDEGLYYAYSRSNFYDSSCIGSFLRDGDGVGWATIFPEEIIGEGKIGFLVPHPREIFLADDKYGNANLMHRKFKWTIFQIKDALTEAEIKKLSLGLQQTIAKGDLITAKHEFIWSVWPNENYIPGSLSQKNRRYITRFVQVDGPHLIREGGLDMFPPVWRVKKPSNLPYGRGLIGEALISVYTANQFGKVMLDAGEFSVNPPWWIPKEMRDEFDKTPGGENFYQDPSREIKAMNPGIKYPFGAEERRDVREAVRQNFKTDYFTALTKAAMEGRTLTIPQVMEIQGEKAASMGPDLGTLNTVLDKIHGKSFDIEMNAGRLPPPPQIILDKMLEEEQRTGRVQKSGSIEIDYIGPLAQAQKRLFKTEGIRHSIESLGPLVDLQMAAQQPVTALDRLDVDETVEELFDAHGMPQKLMRSDEEVEEIQEVRMKAQQAREAAELAAGAADAIPKLGKKVEEGSPLAALKG
jgi:hypothetical protein